MANNLTEGIHVPRMGFEASIITDEFGTYCASESSGGCKSCNYVLRGNGCPNGKNSKPFYANPKQL